MRLRKEYFLVIAFLIFAQLVPGQTNVDSTLSVYDRYWELQEGLYRVMQDGKMGVVDKEGSVLVPIDFNQIWNLDDKGFFRVLKKGKAGVYHQSGRVIIPPEYDQIWSFSDGWAKVMRNGKLGYFNEEGQPVVPCEYQQIWAFEDGRARVLKGGNVGYINESGTEIIPAVYQQIWSFEDGRARVLKAGKVGYVDEAGTEIVPPMYSHIWEFEDGKAKALLDGKMLWIDENGQILDLPIEQDLGDQYLEKESATSPKEKHIIIENDWGDKTHIKVFGSHVIVREKGSDTYVEIGSGRSNYKKALPHRRFRGHYTGLEFGLCSYVGPNGSTDLPDDADFMSLDQVRSNTVAFNFMQLSMGLQRRGNIGLVSGLGIEHSRYSLAGPYLLTKDENGNTNYTVSDRDIKSNRLSTTYLNVPLLLEFQIPTNRNSHAFYFSAGAIGGFRLNSYTRTRYNDNNGPGKERTTSNFNLQDWRYGVMARMGYRAINLYGSYYFSPLFKTDKGPELYPVSVGVSIAFNMWELNR